MGKEKEQTLSAAQLEAVSKGNYGRATGLVKRLVATADDALHRLQELQDQLVDETQKGAEREIARPEKERLLLVVHGDGYVEVFGEKWHSVKVIHVPKVPRRQEQLVLELLQENLPKPYAELFYPGKLRASGCAAGCPTVASLKLAAEYKAANEYLNRLGA